MEAHRRVAVVLGAVGTTLMRGIYQAARPHLPWHFLAMNLSTTDWAERVRRWGADGLILQVRSHREMRQAMALDVPVVDLCGRGDPHPWPRVGPDADAQARVAVQHLRDCGYPCGAFYGPRDHANADGRWRAFKRVAADAGWPVTRLDTARIRPTADDPPGIGFTGEEPALIHWVRRRRQATGVWCTNDTWAFWLAEVCHYLGVPVPERIGICGTGDEPDRCLAAHPALSSVALPKVELAGQAVQCLQELFDRGCSRPPPSLPVSVHARGSTDRWSSDDPMLEEMMHLIRERACQGLGPDGLARSLSVGRRSLEDRCRSAFGCSPFRLIRRQRLRTAAELLRDTDLPIGTVAERCGWATTARFSNEFRTAYDHTPSDWRMHSRA